MRKSTLSLMLVVLLILISTTVVSAKGVNWDGDPSFPIEGKVGLWGHVIAGWVADEPPHADYKWEVKEGDNRIELKGCARKAADGQPLFVRVWFSEGRNGEPIGEKEVQGRASNHWICASVKTGVDHHNDGGDHDDHQS